MPDNRYPIGSTSEDIVIDGQNVKLFFTIWHGCIDGYGSFYLYLTLLSPTEGTFYTSDNLALT